MCSQKQLQANRRNARKSTGPRTDAGKKVSSMNGLTHGLTAQDCPILPGEDVERYNAFHDALTRDLRPAGILQHQLVEDITQLRWKLRRIPSIEAEIMKREQEAALKRHHTQLEYRQVEPDSLPATSPIEILASAFSYDQDNAYGRLELYRMRLTRAMHTALRELRKLREETGGEELCSTGVSPVPAQPEPIDKQKEHAEQKEHGQDVRAANAGKTEPIFERNPRPPHEKCAAKLGPAVMAALART